MIRLAIVGNELCPLMTSHCLSLSRASERQHLQYPALSQLTCRVSFAAYILCRLAKSNFHPSCLRFFFLFYFLCYTWCCRQVSLWTINKKIYFLFLRSWKVENIRRRRGRRRIINNFLFKKFFKCVTQLQCSLVNFPQEIYLSFGKKLFIIYFLLFWAKKKKTCSVTLCTRSQVYSLTSCMYIYVRERGKFDVHFVKSLWKVNRGGGVADLLYRDWVEG